MFFHCIGMMWDISWCMLGGRVIYMGRVWHVDEGPSHERSYSKSAKPTPSLTFWSSDLPVIICPCLQNEYGLHMFAMTQSQQNQGSSLCPANDSACSHTQHGHQPLAGLYWFIGARVTLNSLARHVTLPGSLDLGKAARSQGEEERMWKEARHDRSPSCFLSSSSARCWTGWRPMGPKDPGHQGTWRQYSTSRLEGYANKGQLVHPPSPSSNLHWAAFVAPQTARKHQAEPSHANYPAAVVVYSPLAWVS